MRILLQTFRKQEFIKKDKQPKKIPKKGLSKAALSRSNQQCLRGAESKAKATID